MPSRFIVGQEFCLPCKFHQARIVRGGRLSSQYEYFCDHPNEETKKFKPMGFHELGKYIGNDKTRPDWCCIRGNKELEDEAEITD